MSVQKHEVPTRPSNSDNSNPSPLHNLPGADEIITFSNDSFEANFYEKSIEQSSFLNELLSRQDRYDVVFFTTHLSYNTDFIKKFISPTGIVINATENDLPSDDYGSLMRLMFKVRSATTTNYLIFLKRSINF